MNEIGSTGKDIVVSIGGELSGLKSSLKEAKTIIADFGKSYSGFDVKENVVDTMSLSRAMNQLNQAKSLGRAAAEMEHLGIQIPYVQENLGEFQKAFDDSFKKQTKALKKVKTEFQGWALGIMFAGMMIKNAMDSIWRSSSKVFQDVMHSVDGTVTGFDLLNTSMAYLGYAVGSALEPIAEFLAPIIWMIAEWVLENQNVVTTLFPIISIIGTVLFLVGAAVLAVASLSEAWMKIKLLLEGFKFLKFLAFTGAIVFALTMTLALIAVLAVLWDSWDNIIKGFGLKFQWLGLEVQKFWFQLEKGAAFLGFVFGMIGETFIVFFKKLINFFLLGVEKTVNDALWWINQIIKVMQWLGVSIKTIPQFVVPKLDISDSESKIRKLETDWVNAYNAIDKKQQNVLSNQIKLEQEMQFNQNDALDEMSKNFNDLKALFGLDGTNNLVDSEVERAVTPEQKTVTNNVNLTIEKQREGESSEDFANRILQKIQEGLA